MTSSSSSVFTLSIKPAGDAPAYVHPYHLGTQESIAYEFAHEIADRIVNNGGSLESVALMRNGTIFDVFDGHSWSSDDSFLYDDLDRWEEDERRARRREAALEAC